MPKNYQIPPTDVLDALEQEQIEAFNNWRISHLDPTKQNKYIRLDLRGANLTNKTISGALLQSSCFNLASLQKLVCENSDCSHVNFWKVNLSNATLNQSNLRWTNLFYAVLVNTMIKDADLSFAQLGEADLTGANLTRSNLSSADFGQANLSGVILDKTDISGARFTQAIFDDATSIKNISLEPKLFPYFKLTAPNKLLKIIERDNPGLLSYLENQSDQVLVEKTKIQAYREYLLENGIN